MALSTCKIASSSLKDGQELSPKHDHVERPPIHLNQREDCKGLQKVMLKYNQVPTIVPHRPTPEGGKNFHSQTALRSYVITINILGNEMVGLTWPSFI